MSTICGRPSVVGRSMGPVEGRRGVQGASGLDSVVIFAAAARTQDECRFVAGATNMLARYHEAVAPIAQVSALGPILGRTANGTLVLAAPVDYIAWLECVGATAKRPDLQAPEKVLFVSGRLTPLAQKESTKRGWKVFEAFTTAAAQ